MVNTGDVSQKTCNISNLVYKYARPEHLPHIWCPGCGNGIIMRDVMQAIENLGLNRNKTVIVSGIGCSSRAAGYLDFNTIHTTHGRAIAFATGIKLARPELEVLVLTGDGDVSAHRGKPPDSRGKAQHRADGGGIQQLHLRHDRRTVFPHHAPRRVRHHGALRATWTAPLTSRAWLSAPEPPMRPGAASIMSRRPSP